MLKYIKRGSSDCGQTNYYIRRGYSYEIYSIISQYLLRFYQKYNKKKMLRYTAIIRGTPLAFVLLMIVVSCIRTGDGQVTFSRDWNPGKRSPSVEGNCLANAKSTAAACHVLMNELRQLAACEAHAVVQFLKNQDDVGADQAMFAGGR